MIDFRKILSLNEVIILRIWPRVHGGRGGKAAVQAHSQFHRDRLTDLDIPETATIYRHIANQLLLPAIGAQVAWLDSCHYCIALTIGNGHVRCRSLRANGRVGHTFHRPETLGIIVAFRKVLNFALLLLPRNSRIEAYFLSDLFDSVLEEDEMLIVDTSAVIR